MNDKIQVIAIVMILIVVVIAMILFIKGKLTKDTFIDSANYHNFGGGPGAGYAEYSKTTVGPDPFGAVLPTLKARVYNFRNEIISYNTLQEALQNAQPYEKIAVVSIDNPKIYTRPLQDIPQVIKFVCPYVEQMLTLRGLKLARNPNDGTIIYSPATFESYPYEIGFWVFCEPMSSVY